MPGSRVATAHHCSPVCYIAGRWGEERKNARPCAVCGEPVGGKRRVVCGAACDARRKSDGQAGSRSVFWRGGRSAPYDRAWRIIRDEILERDGHRCTRCGGTDRVQVHHVVPYRYSKSHAPSNLTTLCRSCHSIEEIKCNAAMRATLLNGKPRREKR